MQQNEEKIFSARQKIRQLRLVSSILHLGLLLVVAFIGFATLPNWGVKQNFSQDSQIELRTDRQLLLESLDRIARYQYYYKELYGKYTREIPRLHLPSNLTLGTWETVRRKYEISVLELQGNRFLLLATGIRNGDRIIVDQSFRVSANFVLPSPAKGYLLEEADRLIQSKNKGLNPVSGVVSGFWELESPAENGDSWVAVGAKNPVAGVRRYEEIVKVNIFDLVSDKLNAAMSESKESKRILASVSKSALLSEDEKEVLTIGDVQEWLLAARQAQHVYRREKGDFAKKWEELDSVSNFDFTGKIAKAKNIRVLPIELIPQPSSYRLIVEGTSGDLMGEQFIMDENGSMRQVRYTEALIQQLQETTNVLENTLKFQINPVKERGKDQKLP
ncbi:MAG: hypothetical protein M9962_07310 [Oligoflexia bacterium]|nr:hypothetical protein [Oligoflexia bacterium]